jgi:hypothetical protein
MRKGLTIGAAALLVLGVVAVITWPTGGHRAGHTFRLVADPYGTATPKIVWQGGRRRPLRLSDYYDTVVTSPDGRSAVLGGDTSDGRIQFVDLVRQQLSSRIRVISWPPTGCTTQPLVWTRSHRVVVLGTCADAHRIGASELDVVDTKQRKRMAVVPLGNVIRAVRRRGAVTILSSPELGPIDDGTYARLERLGPARLFEVRSDGSIARLVLPIQAGLENSRTFNRLPGLDVRDGVAVVVGEGDGAALIDLRRRLVTYRRVSFPPRPRRLAPFHSHTGTNNPSRDLDREAYWIDAHHVAVVGYDDWTSARGDQTLPAGLRILDTRTWRVRFVDRGAYAARTAHGVVLVWGASQDGLRGYDGNGSLRYRVLTGRVIAFYGLRRGEAFVSASRGRRRPQTFAVNVRTGRLRVVPRSSMPAPQST